MLNCAQTYHAKFGATNPEGAKLYSERNLEHVQFDQNSSLAPSGFLAPNLAW